jgi:hypothetical protein
VRNPTRFDAPAPSSQLLYGVFQRPVRRKNAAGCRLAACPPPLRLRRIRRSLGEGGKAEARSSGAQFCKHGAGRSGMRGCKAFTCGLSRSDCEEAIAVGAGFMKPGLPIQESGDDMRRIARAAGNARVRSCLV